MSIEESACNAIRLRDLPALNAAGNRCTRNPKLATLSFERIPKLEHCKIDGCSSIVDVSLNDLPRLVAFDLCYPFGSDALGLGPPPVFRLRQAEGLPALNELTLTGYRFHRDTAINIGRIPSLQELYLSDSWVADADMQQLESLGELRSLNLVGTDVTPAGLDLIAKLPHLKKLEFAGGSLVHLDQTIRKRFPAQVEIEPLLVPGRLGVDSIAESLVASDREIRSRSGINGMRAARWTTTICRRSTGSAASRRSTCGAPT